MTSVYTPLSHLSDRLPEIDHLIAYAKRALEQGQPAYLDSTRNVTGLTSSRRRASAFETRSFATSTFEKSCQKDRPKSLIRDFDDTCFEYACDDRNVQKKIKSPSAVEIPSLSSMSRKGYSERVKPRGRFLSTSMRRESIAEKMAIERRLSCGPLLMNSVSSSPSRNSVSESIKPARMPSLNTLLTLVSNLQTSNAQETMRLERKIADMALKIETLELQLTLRRSCAPSSTLASQSNSFDLQLSETEGKNAGWGWANLPDHKSGRDSDCFEANLVHRDNSERETWVWKNRTGALHSAPCSPQSPEVESCFF